MNMLAMSEGLAINEVSWSKVMVARFNIMEK